MTEKELNIFYNFIDNNDENYLSTFSIFSCHLAFLLGVYGIKKQNIEITIKYIRYAAKINFNIYEPFLWIFCELNNIKFEENQKQCIFYNICERFCSTINYVFAGNKLDIPERIKNNNNRYFLISKVYFLQTKKMSFHEELEYAAIYGCTYALCIHTSSYLNVNCYPYNQYSIEERKIIGVNYWLLAMKTEFPVCMDDHIFRHNYGIKNDKMISLYISNTCHVLSKKYYESLQKEYNELEKKYIELENIFYYSPGGKGYLECKNRFKKLKNNLFQ